MPPSSKWRWRRFGGDWDFEGAEAAFRRGLALDPANPLAHVHYSWLLMLLGRPDAAFAEAERAHALAPVVAARGRRRVRRRMYHRRSLRRGDRALHRVPAPRSAATCSPSTCAASAISPSQLRDRAVADLESAASLSRRAPFYLGLLGRCYGEFGMRDQRAATVDELGARGPDVMCRRSATSSSTRDSATRERALQYQEQAYEDGASPFNYLSPCIRSLYARSPHHKSASSRCGSSCSRRLTPAACQARGEVSAP